MVGAWIGCLVIIWYVGYAMTTDTEWEVINDDGT